MDCFGAFTPWFVGTRHEASFDEGLVVVCEQNEAFQTLPSKRVDYARVETVLKLLQAHLVPVPEEQGD